MVRKRYPYTRARDRLRVRPKTPAPKTGRLISELSALSGQPRRTIGYYVQRGLLPKPAFRGTARYGRVHLLRLLHISQLQRAGTDILQAIRKHLDALSEADLLASVAAQATPAVATALGLIAPNAPTAASTPELPAVAPTASIPPPSTDLPGEAWRRVALLPGLELWLAADSSQAVQHIARQIQAYCARR